MTPRARRLLADHDEMLSLAAASPVDFTCTGQPPDRYEVCFQARGFARGPDGALIARHVHRCALYLHLEYPRLPPVAEWRTPIFHPNILPPERHGGVCIGSWSASESLSDLCRRLLEMVQYQSFNLDDALDREAAAWVTAHGSPIAAPVDSAAV